MNELKERLRSDLTSAMRARDQVRLRTLRMALTSITNEEVSGGASRQLSDEEIVQMLTREAKKRREAADAYQAAAAWTRRRRSGPRAKCLPATCPRSSPTTSWRASAIAETGAAGRQGMGQVMKAVTPRVADRADGARVAAEVRRQLGAG